MKQIEVGDVFTFKNSSVKYVYYGRKFEEWYNTGGMGEYTYRYIKLDHLLEVEGVKDCEWLGSQIKYSRDQKFDKIITIDTSEAPFDISSRCTTLYNIRRKQAKTITIFE